MSDAKKASDLATSELAVLFRVGAAWRELRRGASMQAFRPMVYGEGDEALDLGQVDALDLLVFHGSARMGELAEALRVDASTRQGGEPPRRRRPRAAPSVG
jgi:hypothetical protein